MSIATTTTSRRRSMTDEIQLVTFHVGNLFLGVDINQVKEINRHLDITPVPHAIECVSGVVNLRGDVVTIINLRSVLKLPNVPITRQNRNVIINSNSEAIGLLVDSINEVVMADADEIEAPPSNVGGVESRYFKGVYKLDSELLVILDVEEVLDASSSSS